VEPLRQRSSKKGPEAKIQQAIIDSLRIKGWYVMVTHGNMYQSGFPDLFACHSVYGQRWIEVKKPEFKGSKFTPAQLECFPKICANGSGVWILTGHKDREYQKLFKRPNWWVYLSGFK
jgi:hypothetical protein